MKRLLLVVVLVLMASVSYSQYFTGLKISGKMWFGSPIALTGAAGTEAVPDAGTYFLVTRAAGTGVKAQDSLTTLAGDAGRLIILQLAGGDTVLDGKNLKLHGDFNGTTDDVIVLLSDGTYYYEVIRSVN